MGKKSEPKQDKFVKVKSSNIDAIRYVEEREELHIRFKTEKVYKYRKVPQTVYDSMLITESIGKFMNKEIRNKYDFQRPDEKEWIKI